MISKSVMPEYKSLLLTTWEGSHSLVDVVVGELGLGVCCPPLVEIRWLACRKWCTLSTFAITSGGDTGSAWLRKCYTLSSFATTAGTHCCSPQSTLGAKWER